MAVKPTDKDTFLREVDEELRREKIGSFVTRYGWYIIGAAALLLAAFGGWIYWQHRQEQQASQASETLVRVLDQLKANKAAEAAPAIDELVASDRVGYRVAGLFARANAQLQTNAIPAAIETLKSIHADANVPQPYRDAALIRQTVLEFDNLPPAEAVQRLQPFAQPGNPWHGSAGEMYAFALMKQQKLPEAGRAFEALAKDLSVPDTIRVRAVQMASTLGFDAVQIDPALAGVEQPGGGAPAQPAQPAQPVQPAQ